MRTGTCARKHDRKHAPKRRRASRWKCVISPIMHTWHGCSCSSAGDGPRLDGGLEAALLLQPGSPQQGVDNGLEVSEPQDLRGAGAKPQGAQEAPGVTVVDHCTSTGTACLHCFAGSCSLPPTNTHSSRCKARRTALRKNDSLHCSCRTAECRLADHQKQDLTPGPGALCFVHCHRHLCGICHHSVLSKLH